MIEESRRTLRDFEEDLRINQRKKSAIDIVYIQAELDDYNLKFREVKTNEVQHSKDQSAK